MVSALAAALALMAGAVAAQDLDRPSDTLLRDLYRSGDETLQAFAPVAQATRHSIVKLNVDGETVALGAVVATNGLVITKASELKQGKLTCWLATGKQVNAELVGTDPDEDVALVRVQATGLKPITWETREVTIGQWAITPGIIDIPHAVGIVSARARRIRPQRAYIGVLFDFNAGGPQLSQVYAGMGADKAGLKSGDIILAVNGTTVTNREGVSEALRDYGAGQTVKLRIQRGGEKFDADVRMMLPGPDQLARGFLPETPTSRLAGAVSQRAEGFASVIQHDTVLQPWLCGGPLVDLDGKAIGLNIARAGRVATYALPAPLVQQIVRTLLIKAERAGDTAK